MGVAQVREAVLEQLQRYWARELVMPSREGIVGCAALRAMTRLACARGADATDRRRHCSARPCCLLRRER